MSLKVDLINELTKKTDRDKQSRVGPSGIGDPCPKCLGKALAGVEDDREFSLYPWLGTAGHAYLETTVFPDAEHELRLYCGDVPGYGPIKGTTDLYMDGLVGDWKFVGKKKITEYRLRGVPLRYRYQAQTYARGCELAGKPVTSIAIIFIPRDSSSVNDIWIHEEAYQPEMVEKVFARAGKIWERVQESGWEDLPSDDDCYNCKMGAW